MLKLVLLQTLSLVVIGLKLELNDDLTKYIQRYDDVKLEFRNLTKMLGGIEQPCFKILRPIFYCVYFLLY